MKKKRERENEKPLIVDYKHKDDEAIHADLDLDSQGTSQISKCLLSLERRVQHHFGGGITGEVGHPGNEGGRAGGDLSQCDGVYGRGHGAARLGFNHFKSDRVVNGGQLSHGHHPTVA